MRIFIDTSAFFALLDSNDSNHKKAKNAWSSMLNPENILVTSDYILVECFALIQNRLGMEAVRAFHEDVLPVVNIEWINSGVHRSGVSALLASSRRRLSLVDCTSFEIMRNLGIRTVFTFDPHFKEQSFICVP
ncbi:MAG: PIN domain-containing protein [Nitrospirae bacterium]|nr:PIN domain-containing protein [Nitrospirota bacterium]